MLTKEDADKLKRIGVFDLNDLLLFTPKNYQINLPSKALHPGIEHLLQVRITQMQRQHKRLVGHGVLVDFDETVEIIFFNYAKYHLSLFQPDSLHYLRGKLERNRFGLQLIQPRTVGKLGEIVPEYPCQPLKNVSLLAIAKRVITPESLETTPLSPQHQKALLEIHHPDESFAIEFKKQKALPPLHLESLKLLEAYTHLQRLQAKKRTFPAIRPLGPGLLESFLASLPFTPTRDQHQAIMDIQHDLSQSTAARRVVIGDVGSGKTLIILAASACAHPHRSVLMAPTTILADQLYAEAQKLLPKEMSVALLTSESKQLPDADFTIGTHALLYANLQNVPLVMIDEQHRFGTNQRSGLEKMMRQDGHRPHTLQFSATPIPRTQAMIESSLVDFSFIKQLPFPKNIQTQVISKSGFKQLLQHIHTESQADHQTIIVYPLVEESENHEYMSITEGESFWKKQFPDVYTTHGKDKNKEKVLQEFRKKGRLLLATTVIEVGISLPQLSTIIIVGAERLGLATLHQLRGRVSRTGLQGYCYLYTHHPDNERLREFAQTPSGFDIAELDLKYRNSGDLLRGISQSGKNFKWLDIREDRNIIAQAKALLHPEKSG